MAICRFHCHRHLFSVTDVSVNQCQWQVTVLPMYHQFHLKTKKRVVSMSPVFSNFDARLAQIQILRCLILFRTVMLKQCTCIYDELSSLKENGLWTRLAQSIGINDFNVRTWDKI